MPDDFAVGRVEERNLQSVPVPRSLERACRVTLGLLQDVLRVHSHLLCFNDAEKLAAYEQSVVSRAARCGQFLDGDTVERGKVEPVIVADDFPGGLNGSKPRVNALLPGLPFGLIHSLYVAGRRGI